MADMEGGAGRRAVRAAALSLAVVWVIGCEPSASRDPGETPTRAAPPSGSATPARELDGATPVEVGEPIDVRGLRGQIVFDDFEDVFVMRADGTRIRPVTDRPGQEFDGAWSPDGRRIAYRDSRRGINENDEIFVVDADGADPRNISRHPANDWGPDWSPDGRTIVFNSDRGDGTLSGYLSSPDGTDLRRIHTDVWVEYPSFSPDGTRIAFMSHDGGDYDIWVAVVATGETTALTDAPGSDGWPAWSPDGSTIAFTSERDDCLNAGEDDTCWVGDEPGEHRDVWIMDADGTDERRVTPEFGQFVTWSPDGRHLLVSGYDLFVIRPDGTGRVSLSDGGGIPDWVASR